MMGKEVILVRLEDLIVSPFYIKLEEKYRNFLLNKSLRKVKNIKALSKIIKCHKDTISNFLEYGTSINTLTFKRLLHFLNININEVEKQVISIKRGCSNTEVKVKLPIKATSRLALLLAKSLGDGGVSSDFRFHYSNNQLNLVHEVITAVEKSIGIGTYNLQDRVERETYEIKFSSVIGYILHLIGAPKGSKIEQEFFIPKWIMEGNKKIKSYFLKGIFDDEACANHQGHTRRILFAMGKIQTYELSLSRFLNQIKQLLKEFNVNTSQIRTQEIYGDRIILKFVIYRKANFENFRDLIGFSHKHKNKILIDMVNSYVDKQKTKKLVLKTIKVSSKPLTIKNVAELNKIKKALADYHLRNLFKEKLINKIEGNPTFWY